MGENLGFFCNVREYHCENKSFVWDVLAVTAAHSNINVFFGLEDAILWRGFAQPCTHKSQIIDVT